MKSSLDSVAPFLATPRSDILLRVKDLSVDFHTTSGVVRGIEKVSFDLRKGQVLGLVGESGSGKSVTALSLLRLMPEEVAELTEGQILLDGVDLVGLTEREMRRIRGRDIGMIFQDPMTSLNPLMKIGSQVAEPLRFHLGMTRNAAMRRAGELLDLVGIKDPVRRLDQYPHELSGGMRQRVLIATAIACEPRLLIADEPTTALDVTTQAQILDLLQKLRDDMGVAIILITHDLGVVAEFADDVQVMYAGRPVERAPVGHIFEDPAHPYTQGLLRSIPRFDIAADRLTSIEGTVPSPLAMPPGCPFLPRCEKGHPECSQRVPPFTTLAKERFVACFYPLSEGSARL
ncbi:ABC transporter ATP-binding protein [Agrobacterium sp. S2]|nr:ABC transporter ATP-binding protein [Agrobacterium sp. S2]